MKKVFAVLILTMLVTVRAFAQDAKNWVAGNVGLLGAGAQYERVLTPKLSVGGGVYWYSLFLLWNNLGVEGTVRWYPLEGKVAGFFAEAGVGFGLRTGLFNTIGFLIRPGVGWKFDVEQPGGFYVEPSLSMPIVFGRQGIVNSKEDNFGVGVGFIPRVALGYAF